jgi:Icc-related predicted phosphoesterase
MEFIVSSLDVPLFFVKGNHSILDDKKSDQHYNGSIDLHCRVMEYHGCTFAGVEGSLRYKEGPYQYSQAGMWLNVFKLVPTLLMNRIKYGRYLNVFVSHAPACGIHDQTDLPHRGINAFRWLITRFHPDYYLHGHIHVYRPDMVTETVFGKTKVINAFGYRKVELLGN